MLRQIKRMMGGQDRELIATSQVKAGFRHPSCRMPLMLPVGDIRRRLQDTPRLQDSDLKRGVYGVYGVYQIGKFGPDKSMTGG